MRRAAALALACALVCGAAFTALLAAPVPARAATVTVSAFADLLHRAADAVTPAAKSSETTAAAVTAADAVDALLPVTLDVTEGTATITVDLSGVHSLTATLRAAASVTARRSAAAALSVRLSALASAVGTTTTAVTDPSDPAALKDLVAALPRSSNTAQDWVDRQIEKILNAIVKWLGGFGPRGATPGAGANRATTLLVLLVPIVLALIVVLRALRTRRRRAAAGTIPDSEAAPGAPAVAAAADLPQDALGYAASLAAAGAHRDAVRALYGGAARHLVEAGAVSRMRTRTNHEMLRDVSTAAPALAAPFEALTSDFERAWYGHAEPGAAGFEHARSVYGRIVEGVPTRAGAATTVSAPGPDPAAEATQAPAPSAPEPGERP